MTRLVATSCFLACIAVTGAWAAPLSVPAPTSAPGFETIADRQMEVIVNNTHLRSKPNTQSAKLATLKMGTKVDVVEMVSSGQWAHVKLEGKDGYIRADLLK